MVFDLIVINYARLSYDLHPSLVYIKEAKSALVQYEL